MCVFLQGGVGKVGVEPKIKLEVKQHSYLKKKKKSCLDYKEGDNCALKKEEKIIKKIKIFFFLTYL